ncbi:hypothetical protein B0192_22250 [Leptospira interrogans serovar Australis]|nr:hypothetical protein B0192_22250 [Leptospira interrogans serovar Australis]
MGIKSELHPIRKWGITIKYKKNHHPIRFLHKTVVLRPSSKFKSHFNVNSAEKEFCACPKTVQLRKFNYMKTLESSQLAKCDLICGNYYSLLKISKELSCKIF